MQSILTPKCFTDFFRSKHGDFCGGPRTVALVSVQNIKIFFLINPVSDLFMKLGRWYAIYTICYLVTSGDHLYLFESKSTRTDFCEISAQKIFMASFYGYVSCNYLPQHYRASMRMQVTFNHQVSMSSWCSFY